MECRGYEIQQLLRSERIPQTIRSARLGSVGANFVSLALALPLYRWEASPFICPPIPLRARPAPAVLRMRGLSASRCAESELPDRCGVFARVGTLRISDELAGLIGPAGGGQELAQAINSFRTGRRDLHGQTIGLFGFGAILVVSEQRGQGGGHFGIGQPIGGVSAGLSIRKDLLGRIAPIVERLGRRLAGEGVLRLKWTGSV